MSNVCRHPNEAVTSRMVSIITRRFRPAFIREVCVVYCRDCRVDLMSSNRGWFEHVDIAGQHFDHLKTWQYAHMTLREQEQALCL